VGQVTNPLPASGGDSPEQIADARTNAPLTVLTFDRIVSLQDFEDFARAFRGIGKAQVLLLWNGEQQVVHITIAAANGDTVNPQSDLYINLLRAIEAARDPLQRVCIGGYTRRLFRVAAKIRIDSRQLKEEVFAAVKTTLREAFAFERRAFGQPVTAAEVISVIQNVPGVIAVDLDMLYRSRIDLTKHANLLPAATARWSAANGGPAVGCDAILPAELLLINREGITLSEMPL
jgi:predicted phage baseplate assembly protein